MNALKLFLSEHDRACAYHVGISDTECDCGRDQADAEDAARDEVIAQLQNGLFVRDMQYQKITAELTAMRAVIKAARVYVNSRSIVSAPPRFSKFQAIQDALAELNRLQKAEEK